MGEILHAAIGALGVILVIDDVEAFVGEEALLDRDPPGAVMGIAVALQADGTGHGASLFLIGAKHSACPGKVGTGFPTRACAKIKERMSRKSANRFSD